MRWYDTEGEWHEAKVVEEESVSVGGKDGKTEMC